MWFWTYHIRNNVNYQGEWSLQHILTPWPRHGVLGPLACMRRGRGMPLEWPEVLGPSQLHRGPAAEALAKTAIPLVA